MSYLIILEKKTELKGNWNRKSFSYLHINYITYFECETSSKTRCHLSNLLYSVRK